MMMMVPSSTKRRSGGGVLLIRRRPLLLWAPSVWLLWLLLISSTSEVVVKAQSVSACEPEPISIPHHHPSPPPPPESRTRPNNDRRVYKVGVLAIRGFEAAQAEFGATFDEYLTATAGQRFDPPLSFELVPLNFMDIFTQSEARAVDFVYLNPSAFSCIESEFTAYSLVSQMSRRRIHGQVYDLEKFGGVIMVRADDSTIYTVRDIRDKIVAAASLSGLGSGQMQFLELQRAGMSYIQDPQQLVFTSNQAKVVRGVLEGDFDVGFVRTDQMERTTLDYDNGTSVPIDTKLFRIIDPKPNLTIEGEPFPFQASTPLYPEWNVAALDHVPDVVSRQVQNALLALSEHGQVGVQLQDCQAQFGYTQEDCESMWHDSYSYQESTNTTINNNSTTLEAMRIFQEGTAARRCDTTPEIARIALKAMTAGKYAKWMTTLSYMQLRTMQEATGFIYQDPHTNVWKCYRSSELYDTITCPPEYHLKPRYEVANSCAAQGLECQDGFQCVCKPCSRIQVCLDAVELRGNCVPYKVLLPSILVPLLVVCVVLVHLYVEYKRQQADSVWAVQPQELLFDSPSKIIGMGTFGYVLAAEYRGTQVAVKRVIPPHVSSQRRRSLFSSLFHTTLQPKKGGLPLEVVDLSYSTPNEDDLESQTSTHRRAGGGGGEGEGDTNNPGLQSMAAHTMLPCSDIGIAGVTEHKTPRQQPSHRQLRADFIREMRHIAKLRHPCITTVMGAVISKVSEPMLVMEYMEQGSLYDVLRGDKTLDADERLMPILQDIAQGVRFLHAAQPQVVHGDLKAKNVLIDSNYRAKVTDFGLSAKTEKHSAAGTPYWMAPELLRRESPNTAESDMYAMGVLMYELYSRQNPYQGRRDHKRVLCQICDHRVKLRPEIPSSCPPKVAELMELCWSAEPRARPTAENVDLLLRVEGSVKERTSRLEKLNSELEQANEKIAAASSMQLEHFACMSHEIRTPLNCIVGLSSLMESTDMTSSQKESMSMIMSSSRLLQSIVDDVLDYSKLHSGNAEVQIKKTSLPDIVSDLVNSMRASSLVRKRNVTIQVHYHPSVPQYIKTDGRKLLQVLFNLVSNASKFSRDNGVVEIKGEVVEDEGFSRSGEQEKIALLSANHRQRKQWLRFHVKDYGKGIEKQHFGSIFKPFSQTNSGIRNIDGGTGLGLAITEKLVVALGGTISVDSVLEEWTEFTVDLPYEGSLSSIEGMSSRLSKSEFFFVGDEHGPQCQKLAEIFNYSGLSFTPYSSIDDFEIRTHYRVKSSSAKTVDFCFLQEGLDEEWIQKLSDSSGIKMLTLDWPSKPKVAIANYQCVEEMLPASFLLSLCELVDQYSSKRFLKANDDVTLESNGEELDDSSISRLRVLIAEDNIVNQKIVVRMLNRLGLEQVEVVDNGQKAVEREAANPFDLILMDMQMPVMGGVEATRLIMRRKGGNHPLPIVVFATAHVSSSFEDLCFECGAAAYLPKPYTVSELKKTLYDAVNSSRHFSV